MHIKNYSDGESLCFGTYIQNSRYMAHIENKQSGCEAQSTGTRRQNNCISTYGATIEYIEKFGSPLERAKIKIFKKLLEGGG